MNFYSTRNKNLKYPFGQAVRQGLAPDGGLFMPEIIPLLPADFYRQLPELSLPQIAEIILRPYTNDDIPDDALHEICRTAFTFPAPLVRLSDNLYALELYHGPTMAFKDFGARLLARTLNYLNRHRQQRNVVLVATSGDTGSAVASGFYGLEHIEVVILYPYGKISDLQERQMTTLGGNIHALAIDGNFDDCQRLVKTAFNDRQLAATYGLTSANSINIARLLPQMIYYFYAWGQLAGHHTQIVFSVPSGNYGNLTAGILAQKMGLPVQHFLAAANANNTVPAYLQSGHFEPRPTIATLSNAMDVGNPSNFERLQSLFDNNLDSFRQHIAGYSFDDEQTLAAITRLYREYNYLADPHGAVGYLALEAWLKENGGTGIFLETAHPTKFADTVEKATGRLPELPAAWQGLEKKDKHFIRCSSDYKDFLDCLTTALS